MIKNFTNKKIRNKKEGQVVMIITLTFLTISSFIVYAIIDPIISNYRSTESFMKSKQAFMIANSAAEESMYKLRKQLNVPSTETLSFNSGSAEISVADNFDGKTITVESEVDSFFRNIQINAVDTEGVSFNYGMQAGRGGFQMLGGAIINGNVYSNGDVLGSGGPVVTGTAVAATVSLPTPVTTSSSTIPPPYSINFGGDTTPEDIAQSFTISTTTPISSVRFYIKRETSSPINDITLRITEDNGGKPDKGTLASATVPYEQITTSYNYFSIPFDSPAELTPGETYWLVFDGKNTVGTFYSLGSDLDIYNDGLAKEGEWKASNGGTWDDTSPSGLDIYFDFYAGGDTGMIDGVNIGQDGGDAWAYEVNNSTVDGTIYCQISSGNNQSCDNSRPDPPEIPFPISDGNIIAWKDEAEDGGTTVGDITYGSSDVGNLGPQKIEGNLIVGAGATLYINGTLWVTGDVTVTGGGEVKLASSFAENSGVLVTDGEISVSGGGGFDGSGTEGSYVLAVTTSTSINAVDVSGDTGSVVLNAQKGTIEFSGGAIAKQATGETVVMNGGTTVNYEGGLTNINFYSGPAGSLSIKSWDEF